MALTAAYHLDRAEAWRRLERKGKRLIAQFACLAFVAVAELFFPNQYALTTCVIGAGLWVCVGFLCWVSVSQDECRRWCEYHELLAADPLMWPWPPLPSELRSR